MVDVDRRKQCRRRGRLQVVRIQDLGAKRTNGSRQHLKYAASAPNTQLAHPSAAAGLYRRYRRALSREPCRLLVISSLLGRLLVRFLADFLGLWIFWQALDMDTLASLPDTGGSPHSTSIPKNHRCPPSMPSLMPSLMGSNIMNGPQHFLAPP